MIDRGPDPQGSGPRPSPEGELERARQRLYAPGGASGAAVTEYERLRTLTGQSRREPDPGKDPGPIIESAGGPDASGRRRLSRRTALVIVGAALVAVVGTVAVLTASPALPDRVAVPALDGTSLLAFERVADRATGPGSITYQPEGNTVYQGDGRIVAVALRCVGDGTVLISAGSRFLFRCTSAPHQEVIRDARPWSGPFVIVGTTTGNVVWAARIVLLPPQSTGGSIPTFAEPCDSCAVLKG